MCSFNLAVQQVPNLLNSTDRDPRERGSRPLILYR